MKALIISILLNSFIFSALARISPHDAARQGDIKTLRQYRFEGENLYQPDARGFIPYELSAIHADINNAQNLRKHVETMLWLKEMNPKKHRYSQAMIKLIQAGLKSLGYKINQPDGLLGKNTIAEIKHYQQQNNLATTGRPGPQWLGIFYRDTLKELQKNLTILGYNTNGSDGLMGKATRTTLLKYRKQQKLFNPSYGYVDALIVNHAYMAVQKKQQDSQKAAKLKALNKDKEQLRYTQAGLKLLGYPIGEIDGLPGKRTTDAIRKFQKSYKLPTTGKIDEKTRHLMDIVFLKSTQKHLNSLGYELGKADGKMGNRTQIAIKQFNKKHRIKEEATITSTIMSQLHQKIVKQQKAAKTRKKQAAKVQKKQPVQVKKKQLAEKVKRKHLVTKAEKRRLVEKDKKKINAIDEKKRLAKLKFKKQKTDQDTILLAKQKNTITMSKNNKHLQGNSAKGSMIFTRKGGQVIGCRLAGRNIPIEWCEPFYPLPPKNYCKANFSPTNGTVTNLWCR